MDDTTPQPYTGEELGCPTCFRTYWPRRQQRGVPTCAKCHGPLLPMSRIAAMPVARFFSPLALRRVGGPTPNLARGPLSHRAE